MTDNLYKCTCDLTIKNHKSSIDDDRPDFVNTPYSKSSIINHLLMMTDPLDLGLLSVLLLLPKSLKSPVNS